MAEHHDIIIIGTGAGGGTIARALAKAGKKILLLERGGWLPREKQNWDQRSVLVDARYKSGETFFDKNGKPFHPSTHYWVGGNTKVYGAALIRLRKEDFGAIKHYGGVSPAWPITYEELEPFYTRAEHWYNVHGERGVDPTEPHASAPYAKPAVSHEGPIAELAEGMKGLGLQPFPMPIGIDLEEKNPEKGRCIRCDTCDGFPCLVDGKSDAQTCGVMHALQSPNVAIVTNAFVKKLATDPSGRRVTKVVVERAGVIEEHSADLVVVACGAINSAALLLRSATDKHPRGLANSSDQVGRNYMAHHNSGLLCVSTKPNPTVFQKTMGMNDYYFASREFEMPLGHLSMLGKMSGVGMKAGAPGFVPTCVLNAMARHSYDFWLTTEDLPHHENRVTQDRDGNIHLAYTPNNLHAHGMLIRKTKQIIAELFPLGLKLHKQLGVEATPHQCGTLRMGTDARTSVVDTTCKAHDLDNLYVADASVFPASAAVNPALTIMANALRVAEHIRARTA
jgi:choline dehydrogenase-like flavoprotein